MECLALERKESLDLVFNLIIKSKRKTGKYHHQKRKEQFFFFSVRCSKTDKGLVLVGVKYFLLTVLQGGGFVVLSKTEKEKAAHRNECQHDLSSRDSATDLVNLTNYIHTYGLLWMLSINDN